MLQLEVELELVNMKGMYTGRYGIKQFEILRLCHEVVGSPSLEVDLPETSAMKEILYCVGDWTTPP